MMCNLHDDIMNCGMQQKRPTLAIASKVIGIDIENVKLDVSQMTVHEVSVTPVEFSVRRMFHNSAELRGFETNNDGEEEQIIIRITRISTKRPIIQDNDQR